MADLELPSILTSKAVYGNDTSVTGCRVKVYWSGGGLRFFLGLSGNAEDQPADDDWEEVTGLVSGTEKAFTFTLATGRWLFYRIVKDYDTVVYVPRDDFERPTDPAIKISSIVEVI